jgi:hypothetical protein
VTQFANADFTMWNDRIPGAVNRSVGTDFAAPAIDVPTFRRTFSITSTTTGTTNTSAAGDPADHLTFTQVGTSMSDGIVTGSYALVASALDYWTILAHGTGVTSDAYLTQPVGVNTLNFGPHSFKDLSAYNNPDGINGILAYTAVPAADVNDGGSLSTPPLINSTDNQFGFAGSTAPPSYARVSIGNAIASIEGTIAIQYLLDHHIFPLIDANNDGIITAQEIQNFTDTAATKGLPEAGAMARFLGGTSSYAQPERAINNVTFNENPDQPAVLQRRYNYFDYLANGQLKGGITIDSFKMLAHTLLPQPDAYVIVDRQRASANGFLVDPTSQRNFVALQHLLPSYEWVPPSAIKKYRNISPAGFHVNKNEAPGTFLPFFNLFGSGGPSNTVAGTPQVQTGTAGGTTLSVVRVPLVPVSSASPAASQPTQSSTTSTPNTATSPVSSTTPAAASTTPASGSTAPSTAASTAATTPAPAAASSASSSNNAQAILDALKNLAQAASSSAAQGTSSPGNLTPSGTLTPATGTASSNTGATGAGPVPTSSTSPPTTSASTTPAANSTAAHSSTSAPAANSASAQVSPAAAAAANQQQVAAKQAAAKKAQAKKDDFWSKLWKSLH